MRKKSAQVQAQEVIEQSEIVSEATSELEQNQSEVTSESEATEQPEAEAAPELSAALLAQRANADAPPEDESTSDGEAKKDSKTSNKEAKAAAMLSGGLFKTAQFAETRGVKTYISEEMADAWGAGVAPALVKYDLIPEKDLGDYLEKNPILGAVVSTAVLGYSVYMARAEERALLEAKKEQQPKQVDAAKPMFSETTFTG